MTEKPSKAQTRELVKNLIEGLGLEMNRTSRIVIDPYIVTATVVTEPVRVCKDPEDPQFENFRSEDRLFFYGPSN